MANSRLASGEGVIPRSDNRAGRVTDKPGQVVIIGGGIMGSFCAWFLRERGYRGPVTVIERDPSYRFSSTALSAASIRTQFMTPTNTRMSLFAIDLFRNIKTHFGATADIGYMEKGYLVLGAPETVAARRALADRQRDLGADVVTLDPAQLAQRFPFLALDDVGIGTFGQSGEGWFDAWSLLSLVRKSARNRDVRYVTGDVATIDTQGDRATGVRLADGTALPCDTCVLAAGPASGRVAARVGIDLPVRPRKRTVFNFRAPVPGAGFPMLFDISGFWVRPERDGFIGGIQPPADQDPDADGDFDPHPDLLEEHYWPRLAARIPAMEQLRLERCWAGHYEMNTLDQNGVIGPHDVLGNLIFATGFSGHGVMHGPAVGRGVAEHIMTGTYQTLDLGALGWARVRDGLPLVETVVY
jgi:glycine/D-amino acid oxidase-like deaminating enzyme